MLKKKKELDYEKLNDCISLSNKILKVLFITMILAIILIGLYLCKSLKIFDILLNILKVISPLFIGMVIAWLLNSPVKKLEKKGIKRVIGSIFVFFIFIVVLYLFLRIVAPMLYKQTNDFISLLPSLFLEISDFIHNTFDKFSSSGIDLSSVEKNVYSAIENISLSLTTSLPTVLIDFATGLVSSIGTFLLGLIIGFYLLIDFNGVKHILDFVPKKYHNSIYEISSRLDSTFKDFVGGTLLISLVIFIISTIAFKIAGIPSPMLFGLICGITNIIPYIGPWLGGGIAVIVGFTVSPFVGVITAVICFVVQQLDSIVFQPLIMGKTMKLHPVTIMIGLLVFGYLFGIVGMILATPIISGIKVIVNYFDEKYDLIVKLKNKEVEE